jgi:hypothetical protein
MDEPVGTNTAGTLLRVHASAHAVVEVLVREIGLSEAEARAALVAASTLLHRDDERRMSTMAASRTKAAI